jgi:hypothetical protein
MTWFSVLLVVVVVVAMLAVLAVFAFGVYSIVGALFSWWRRRRDWDAPGLTLTPQELTELQDPTNLGAAPPPLEGSADAMGMAQVYANRSGRLGAVTTPLFGLLGPRRPRRSR